MKFYRAIVIGFVVTLPLFVSWATVTPAKVPLRERPALPSISQPEIFAPRTVPPVLPVPAIPELEQAIYDQVNQYRSLKGLSPLLMDTRISAAARRHSQAMAQREIPFGHGGFRQRVLRLNQIIAARRVSENVAYIFTHRETATRVVQGWIKSPQHRPSLEGEFRFTGVGVAQGDRGAFYFTQIYIRPR